jgi:hypothetical protein
MRIIGCDLHARQQTVAMLDTNTGEFVENTLEPMARNSLLDIFYHRIFDFFSGKPPLSTATPVTNTYGATDHASTRLITGVVSVLPADLYAYDFSGDDYLDAAVLLAPS